MPNEDIQTSSLEGETAADETSELEDFISHSKDKEYLKAITEDYSIHETTMSEDGGNLQQRWYSYDEQGTIVYACEKTVFDTEAKATELYQYQMENYADEMEGKLFQEGEILYRLHDMKLEMIINCTNKETEWEEYNLLVGTPEAEYEKYYFSIPLDSETLRVNQSETDTKQDSGDRAPDEVKQYQKEDFASHAGDSEQMQPVTEDYYIYETTNTLDDMILLQHIHSYDEKGNCSHDHIKFVYSSEDAAQKAYEEQTKVPINSGNILNGEIIYSAFEGGCGNTKTDDWEYYLWWQENGDDSEKLLFSQPIQSP